MLVVKLEIHPGGDSSKAEEIGRLDIANLSALAPTSDYQFRIAGGGYLEPKLGRVYDHERDDGAWRLVYDVLCDEFY